MKIRLTKSFLYSLFLHGTIVVLVLALYMSYSGGGEKAVAEKRCKIMLSQVCACTPEKSEPKPPVAEKHRKPKPQKKVVKKERVEKVPAPVAREEVVEETVKEEPPVEEEVEIVEEEIFDDAVDDEETEEVVAASEADTIAPENGRQATASVQSEELTPEEAYIQAHIAEIMSLLKKNLYYPRLARKRGIEGTVTVQFELLVNGEINNITIIKAERDILASATVTTIERMEGKLPLPSEPLLLNVPIMYELH